MATPDKTATAPHLLVVIDHQEARVYRTEFHGAVPERIVPYDDPHGYGRHLDSTHERTDGKRQPERKGFHEAIPKTLRGAEQVTPDQNATNAAIISPAGTPVTVRVIRTGEEAMIARTVFRILDSPPKEPAHG